jgi:hypothetical protein
MINQFTGYKGWVTEGGMGMIDVDSSSAQSASNGKLSVPTTHDLTDGQSTRNVHVRFTAHVPPTTLKFHFSGH